MMRMILGAAALALVLTGCSAATTGENASEGTEGGPPVSVVSEAEFLSQHDLADMDAAQIIDHLDQLPVSERPADMVASVGNSELVLGDETQKVVMELPEGQSYVSIAPFVSETHDCFYHSLTTCLGEMSEEPIEVTFTDSASGETFIDEEVETFDNGFVGFWVPAGIDGTIEVTAGGRSGATEFSTRDGGATCVTDLQLQ